MNLSALKRSVARVELNGTPNGSAFLVDRRHVATALHVLEGRRRVQLAFPEWPRRDCTRTGERIWVDPAGRDVALLELDRECPVDVEPMPWMGREPARGDSWTTFGFPADLPNGHTLTDETVADPSLLITEWDLRILQLGTPSAAYALGGFSGAPCIINGAIAGVITHQLVRVEGVTGSPVASPSLDTLYALPIALLAPSGITPPLFESDDLPEDLVQLADALAGRAKVSLLAAMLRALDRSRGDAAGDTSQRAALAQRLRNSFRLVVHVIGRRENPLVRMLAGQVYERLSRTTLARTAPGLRVPTFLHEEPTFLGEEERPIDPARVEHSVMVLLLDDEMLVDERWRACHDRIVAHTESNTAGASVLPFDLGGPKDRFPDPFREMKVRRLAESQRSTLLIALELHLLRTLARSRGVPPDQAAVRLFLSYAAMDGDAGPRAIRKLAENTPGIEALLDQDTLAPGDRFQVLEERIKDRVLMAFVTSSYTNRAWCLREVLIAKQLGRPIVVVDIQDANVVPRASPYLGNVPWIRSDTNFAAPHDLLEAAVFEQLRYEYEYFNLDNFRLQNETLRDAHVVTRPPELLDVTKGGALFPPPKVILHPDPPLPNEERSVLGSVAPGVRFVSPAQVLADSKSLRGATGAPGRVGLSASPTDVWRSGLMELHFEDTWLDLNRLLLLSGATIVFGGDLRSGGMTDILLDVADQRLAVEPRGQGRPTAPVVSYLAWPASLDLTIERQARLVDRVSFQTLAPPSCNVASYPPGKVPPTTFENRYLYARALTSMRQTVRDTVAAVVVVGGKCTGFVGRYAGVVEETLLAMQRERPLPIFLLGGLGGAAAAIGEALQGRRPERLTGAFQLEASPGERDFARHYNDAIARDSEADDRAPIDHDGVLDFFTRRGLAGLNNGLSDPDNLLLLTSPSTHEIAPVLLQGLRKALAE